MMGRMSARPSPPVVRAWARLERARRAALGTVEARLKLAGLPALEWYDVLLELERAGEAGLRPFELQEAIALQRAVTVEAQETAVGRGRCRASEPS